MVVAHSPHQQPKVTRAAIVAFLDCDVFPGSPGN